MVTHGRQKPGNAVLHADFLQACQKALHKHLVPSSRNLDQARMAYLLPDYTGRTKHFFFLQCRHYWPEASFPGARNFIQTSGVKNEPRSPKALNKNSCTSIHGRRNNECRHNKPEASFPVSMEGALTYGMYNYIDAQLEYGARPL